MFRIKMCGVTSPEDAVLAVEAGADAVGINFFRESVRYVAPEAAGPIVEAIRERATAVAVFVNENPDRIAEICGKLGIGVVQLSGHEPAAGAARIRYPVIKAVHMENEAGLEAFRDYPCRAFLFDASLPGEYGGTGKPLDWEALGRTTGGPLVRFGPAMDARRGTDSGERGRGHPGGTAVRGRRGFRRRGGTREEGPGKNEGVRGSRERRIRDCGNRRVIAGLTGTGISAPSGGGTLRKR